MAIIVGFASAIFPLQGTIIPIYIHASAMTFLAQLISAQQQASIILIQHFGVIVFNTSDQPVVKTASLQHFVG